LFEGLSPGLNDVLVKYTYYGDANLSGAVDGSDYSLVDSTYLSEHFVKGVPTTPISGWYNGDFNYDGVVDGSDYTLMDNAFNEQGPSLASDGVWGTAPTEFGSATVNSITEVPLSGAAGYTETGSGGNAIPTGLIAPPAVPEPASLGLLGVGAIGLLARRNRRSGNMAGNMAGSVAN